MNNNISNDINKFDGKYLKCIVSKYKAVTNYLANSGSMIILQPGGDYINRNYMYLGDEFIASGYGFSTEEVQRNGERIVKTYDLDIAKLKKADATERAERKQDVADLNNKLKEYVKINGGPIENTIIRLDGQNIPTKDIILYGEEAKYTNLEVKDINIYVNGKFFNKEGINKSVYYNETILLCPIGSKINAINIDITTIDNDSGGLEKLVVSHNKNITQYSNDNDVEAVMIKYDYDYDYNLKDENGLEYYDHKWSYSKSFNTYYIVDKTIKNAVKNIYMYVKKTPEAAYKYYPGLERKGYHIVSSGNAIQNNKIDLDKHIDIIPQYYVRWIINKDFNGNDNEEDLGSCLYYSIADNNAPLNYTEESYKTEISIDVNYENNSNINKINIAIPKNFVLHKIYLVNDDLEYFNWTGAVKVRKNIFMPCSYSERNGSSYPCYEYNIYSLDGDNSNFKTNIIKVNIEVLYKGIDLIYENNQLCTYKSTTDIKNSFVQNQWSTNNVDLLNDEEFNNLYWVPGAPNRIVNNGTTKNYYNEIFIPRLNIVKENGLNN